MKKKQQVKDLNYALKRIREFEIALCLLGAATVVNGIVLMIYNITK